MALSDYERKMLEQLEAQLKGEDPSLADTLAPEDPMQMRLALSARHVVLGLIAIVSGLAIVAAGVAFSFVSIGILGTVIVWLGLMYIIRGFSQVPAEVGATVRTSAKNTKESFLERQRRAFEQRRDEGRS